MPWRGDLAGGYDEAMGIPALEIQKFMPIWLFYGFVAAILATFLIVVFVLATTSRQRDENTK